MRRALLLALISTAVLALGLVPLGCAPPPDEPAAELAGSWPQWRGPSRDGIVADPGLDAWMHGNMSPREVWSTPLGAGFSGLVVSSAPGAVAVTTWVDGDRDSGREVVGALDVHTGEVLWTVSLGEVKGSAHGDGPRSTPLVTQEGVVFAMGSFGDLVAVRLGDPPDGSPKNAVEIWRRDLGRLAEGEEPDWGFAASPLLSPDGDRLFVHLGGPASVLALDPATGDTLWQVESFRGYASPVVAELAGREQLLSLTGSELLGLDPASGKVLWRSPRETYYGLNAADPIVMADGQVFLSAHYNAGAALLRVRAETDADADANTAWTVEELWSSRRLRNHFATSYPWPEGDLVVGFDGEFLAALDAASGELLWKARGTGKGQALRIESEPVEGGARLLVLSDECELQLGTVDRQGWTVRARLPLNLDGTCYTMPSLVGRRLFARDGLRAVAVDLAPAP